ncbi:histidinol-phosphate aminotransferase, partial [Phenoliferia sp. Uapishka_3]
MRSFDISVAIRPNILALEPYVCARDEYDEGILLDANENALGHSLPQDKEDDTNHPPPSQMAASFDLLDLHRYPSPSHLPLKQLICTLRNVPSPDNIFLGVGSDEVIDMLFRISCKPGNDRVLICPPTYGMYSVCAQVNDIAVEKVTLDAEDGKFAVKVDEVNSILSSASKSSFPIKLVFLCSPGNPTGTLIPLDDIRKILSNPDYQGLVVVDEAYIDFGEDGTSAVRLLVDEGWPNLVVMQTLSKGFGLAAIRLGIAYSTPALIRVLNAVKAPYNISTPTAALALRALSPSGLTLFRKNIATLNTNRSILQKALLEIPDVLRILGAGDANFLVVQIGRGGKPDNKRAKEVYTRMATDEKVVVRFRGNEHGCEACLRITVGTLEECERVVEKLTMLLKE